LDDHAAVRLGRLACGPRERRRLPSPFRGQPGRASRRAGRPALTEPSEISAQALRDWPLPQPTGNKQSRGQLLVLGGGRSTPGAAMLAGLAALRVGAGVLTLAVSEAVAGTVAAAVPEA